MGDVTLGPALLALLLEVRDLVQRPSGRFTSSSWADADIAAQAVDLALAGVMSADNTPAEAWAVPPQLDQLFAPAGPLSELCRASGWDDFDHLATRFAELCGDVARTPFRVGFPCSICARHAALLEVADDDLQVRRWGMTGTLTAAVDAAVGARVRAAMQQVDAAALYAIDFEFAPCWCPSCSASYCHDHWDRWDVFDEDGLHDSIRGRCPQGHERMIED